MRVSALFTAMELICCICGTRYKTTVNRTWHGFDQAVCGSKCFYEKEWRRMLSVLGKPYKPDPREFDSAGYPIKR